VISEPPELAALPEPIRQRLRTLLQEVDQVTAAASALVTEKLPDEISFTFKNAAPRDILTPYERAQSISFVTRYDQLPTDYTVHVAKVGERFRIANLAHLRHILNDFRPLIMNQDDSVHYHRVHRVWRAMLLLDDPRNGTTIRAHDREHRDVTASVVTTLDQHNKAITLALRSMEFGYLYNGVLQHSGEEFSERLLRDYHSGELNYVVWKHVYILDFIRDALALYYQMMRFLTFPELGPL
jgi:hypothetical protein